MASRAKRQRDTVPAVKGAAVSTEPVPNTAPDKAPTAPWPAVDRYPTILGSSVTLQYVSSVFRLSLTGYRTEYVDCLAELLERDPHAYAAVSQLIMAVASARIMIEPPANLNETDAARARVIADEVRAAILAIPDLQQSIVALLWAIYYAVSASEIGWDFDGKRWRITRLYFIHSRRLSYPDPGSWSVRIWDQGNFSGWGQAEFTAATRNFGISPDDYPGKFIVHTPQLRGEYPTRDGLGRQIAYYMAIKLMGVRAAGQFIERYSKPWPIGYFATSDNTQPRAADTDDIIKLDAALKGLGAGNLSNASLPDSVHIELEGPMAKLTGVAKLVQAELVDLCNREVSEACVGTNEVMQAGPNGSRSATETRDDSTTNIRIEYNRSALASTLQRDLVNVLCRLNYPGEAHLTPVLSLVDKKVPTAAETMDLAVKAVGINVPVDGTALGKAVNLPLVAAGDETATRCVVVKPSAPFDGPLIPEPVEPANDNGEKPNGAPGDKPGKKEKP
jgi:phage gp29-like protein